MNAYLNLRKLNQCDVQKLENITFKYMKYVHKTESKCFASFYYYYYCQHSHETRRSKLDLERSEQFCAFSATCKHLIWTYALHG